MFRNRTFYHQHIRKSLIAFGTLFNGIFIERKNAAGEIAKRMKVPLSYGPKNKQITRLYAIDNLEDGRAAFEVGLPRIGFEIVSFQHDNSRQLPVTQKVRSIKSDNGVVQTFISTPYNINILLSVFAKNQSDGFQVVEQILPYFAPDFNVTIHEIPELGVSRDIQFVLNNMNYSVDYESDFEKRTTVMYDFNFTIKMNLFGYIGDVGLIKKTIISAYNDPDSLGSSAPPDSLDGVRVTTTVDPYDADPASDYSYIQTIDDLLQP